MKQGFVEAASLLGVSGWAVASDAADGPPMVEVWVGGELIGAAVAREPRSDVRDAGHSTDGRCGFRFVFPQLVSSEQLKTLRVAFADGTVLPVVGEQRFDVYDLLFHGSFGRDTSIPFLAFLSTHYIRHNARRLEHLASLQLPLQGKSVVEFGAGVGDHTSFYLDRGCSVLATDARKENLSLLSKRLLHHPLREQISTRVVNVEMPFDLSQKFDVVHCYGLLYHIANAEIAIHHMARHCGGVFLLETKCTPDQELTAVVGEEDRTERYHSYSGKNFRPSRQWLHQVLEAEFPFVYWPVTQPAHEEFASDFKDLGGVEDGWPRTVVVASRFPLGSHMLSPTPPPIYLRA